MTSTSTSLIELLGPRLDALAALLSPTPGAPAPYVRPLLAGALIALTAWLADWVCRRVMKPLLQHLTRRTRTRWDDYLLNDRVLDSACHVVPAAVVCLSLPLVVSAASPGFWGILLLRAGSIYLTVAVMRLGFTFLGGLKTAAEASSRLGRHYVSGFIQMGKLVVGGVGLIVVAGILIDRSPLQLLAGLGVAATVLMLVFKDTLTGLVAGVQLSANNMLVRGDWITVEKEGINGIVQDVTLTTVKVRNFDNTIVTIPPQTLVGQSFQNWRGMRHGPGRRVMRALFIDIHTVRPCTRLELDELVRSGLIEPQEAAEGAVNLTLFRHWAERYLISLPYVVSRSPEVLLMVRQLAPTPHGLPVEFYFFVEDKLWKPYEERLAATLEQLMAAVPRFGLRLYQYPSAWPPAPSA